MSESFIPKAGYTRFPDAYHVIPNDDYKHVTVANTCPCMPTVKGDVVTHNRATYRPFTKAEELKIRAGDVYDPEDSDVSDAIIARGKLTFVGH